MSSDKREDKDSALVFKLTPSEVELANLEIERFSIEYKANAIPSMTVVMRQDMQVEQGWATLTKALSKLAPGKRMRMHLGTLGGTGDGPLLFDGILTDVKIAWTDRVPLVTLEVAHALQKLTVAPKTRAYLHKTDEEIIRGLLRHALRDDAATAPLNQVGSEEVSWSNGVKTEAVNEQMIQWDSTDWRWLQSRLQALDLWLMPHPEGMRIAAPSVDGKEVVTTVTARHAEQDGPGEKIQSAHWNFSNAMLPRGVSVRRWDVDHQKAVSHSGVLSDFGTNAFATSTVTAMSEDTWHIDTMVPLTTSEAELGASGKLRRLRASAVQGKFAFEMNSKTLTYKVGDTVEFAGFGDGLNGKAVISGIRHEAGASGDVTTLSVGLPVSHGVAAELLPRAPQIMVATVAAPSTDNAHPKWDRVAVEVHQLDATIWARRGKPFAPHGQGLHVPLEKGEEVLLAFVDDDPRFPVVLASLHNPVFPAIEVKSDGELVWRTDKALRLEGKEITLVGETINLSDK